MTQRFSALLILLTLLTLSACQPISMETKPSAPDMTSLVSEAEKQGDYAVAAEQYIAKAAESEGALKSAFQYRAAMMHYELGELAEAEALLAETNLQQLTSREQLTANLLRADIALLDLDGLSALQHLDKVDFDSANAAQQKRILELRITAYDLTENWLEKALAHIRLDPMLAENDRENNHLALWQTLMKMTPQALDLYNPGQPPAEDSGWFALAYAVKAYENNPEAMEVAIEDWEFSYPNHPANVEQLKKSIKTPIRLPEQLELIGILLPESGPAANAAQAIRQGIIAAHFNARSNVRLQFYDVRTGNTPDSKNVISQYEKAVADGANIVIGPLDKVSVELLAAHQTLSVPVLALNRISQSNDHSNFFQFALAPEDDARSQAEHANKMGYKRAIVLSPRSEWGDRVAAAFAEEWQTSGGQLVTRAKYDEAENDYSHILTPILGVESSNQRYQNLRRTLGQSLEFEPRRRQDVDFLFMVGRPLKARQLVTQLRFHRSGQLPILATSHAYGGEANAQQDIDLNGLIFTDIPWMFTEQSEQDPAYSAVRRQASGDIGSFLRLAALGVDAYRMIPFLTAMSSSEDEKYQGATGELTINEQGQIERLMPIATIRNGLIEPLQRD
ncbi:MULTISPECIES: penicillin-binding protein activator [unclassified Methylophaga]|jgi:outer membrane PBP1 activator LpoA protein|uniref:penicillin-binding protein activator n=1 Tax=unclassified Methylophaga TaxID=2629249 RepID=UPI000C8FF6A9|nr:MULTISPECIES: penicillin-binding protein activator [unclassified Methylophaga]MAK66937.1 LppC family lipoprotein [Methylophaga sp.]MAY17973.1 LppC family lipoprotein [Methylophaga sp.]HAO24086.1 LppC family lipoprotein [Methylophaga sp.]|tara:strand:+ start:1095 stop:2954 length:1860 start_codon:yes stop_codon:yes gene_type:complete